MHDFVVIGDVTIDHILSVNEAKVLEGIDREHERVSIPFPTKVMLSTPPRTLTGGNAYTVSCALNQLGRSTSIYTVIGNDVEGQGILKQLQTKGINTDLVQHDREKGTNSATILSISGDRVIFTYHHDRTYALPKIPSTRYLYLTSIGENDVPLFEEVLKQKQDQDFTLIFAPGSLQLKESYEEISPVMQQADMLILNKEEAERILKYQSDDFGQLLRGLRDLGPNAVACRECDSRFYVIF